MIPKQIYLILHLVGILLVFTSYGALIARGWLASAHAGLRKFGAITSGVGLLLIFVSGFGMQPAYGFTTWIWIKIFLWLMLGAFLMVINRKPELAIVNYWIIVAIGALAVITVYYKPFGM
jgi:hypothetical protein